MRAASQTPYYISLTTISASIKNGQYMQILSGIIVIVIISIASFALALLFLIFFLIMAFLKKHPSNGMLKKLFIGFSVLLMLASVGILGADIYFVAQTDKYYNDTLCIFSKFPNDLLNGTPSSSDFIGFYGINDMFINLGNEVDNLSTVQTDLQAILDQ